MNKKQLTACLFIVMVVFLAGCTLRGSGSAVQQQAADRTDSVLAASVLVPAGGQPEEGTGAAKPAVETSAAETPVAETPVAEPPVTEAPVQTEQPDEKKPIGYKTTFTKMEFLRQVAATYKMAHDAGYVYGDSHGTPPCSDGYISCDRLIARTLWDLGYTDQPVGGFVVEQEEAYLTRWGFRRIDEQSELRGGDIVIQCDASGHIIHSFVLVFYDPITTECIKYDCGHFTPEGADRISSEQPFYTVLADFPERQFYCGFRIAETFE